MSVILLGFLYVQFHNLFIIIALEEKEQVWIYEKNSDGEFVRYVYEVEESYETEKDDIDVIKPVDEKQLTLMTCTPIGGTHGRWIVKAAYIEE